MRLAAGMIWALTAVGLVGAGGDQKEVDFDKLAKQIAATFNETADVLSKVKDEKTAKEARPQMKEIAGKFQRVMKEAQGFEKLDEAKKEALEKQHKESIEQARKRMASEIGRVLNVEGGPDLLGELESVLKLGGAGKKKVETKPAPEK